MVEGDSLPSGCLLRWCRSFSRLEWSGGAPPFVRSFSFSSAMVSHTSASVAWVEFLVVGVLVFACDSRSSPGQLRVLRAASGVGIFCLILSCCGSCWTGEGCGSLLLCLIQYASPCSGARAWASGILSFSFSWVLPLDYPRVGASGVWR